MRIRPRFLIAVGCFFVLVIALSCCLPEPSGVKKARIIITRVQTKTIATALKERATEAGGLNAVDNALVQAAVFGTNRIYADRTNAQGEVLDYWKTPYKIEIQAQTNFIVGSAGSNRKFGDADDVVFSSISNAFVNSRPK
jgi:hypothetical protein